MPRCWRAPLYEKKRFETKNFYKEMYRSNDLKIEKEVSVLKKLGDGRGIFISTEVSIGSPSHFVLNPTLLFGFTLLPLKSQKEREMISSNKLRA